MAEDMSRFEPPQCGEECERCGEMTELDLDTGLCPECDAYDDGRVAL